MILNVELEEVQVLVEQAQFKLPTTVKMFPWLRRVSIASEDILPEIREAASTTYPDVVEWMQEAASWVAVLDIFEQTVQSNNGVVITDAGDGYIPGVRAGDIRYDSQERSVVASQGYAVVITPEGNFNVPINNDLTITTSNLLAWAANRVPAGTGVQWNGALAFWRELPSAPVTQAMVFPNLSGMVGPQFVKVVPPLGVRHVDYVDLTSDKAQRVVIKFRSPTNYKNVLAELSANIPPGSSRVRIRVLGMGSYITEIQPQDGTKTQLDGYYSRRV